jgi:hypothetical protein
MTNPGSSGAGVIFCPVILELEVTSIHPERKWASTRNPAARYRFAYFSHFMISGSVGRLPYIRMPMR